MNEDFLHFIWQHHLYQPNTLLTEDGQSLEIIHPGLKNTDAGPDFFNAKIRLNGTLWAGNIEIHLDEADWYKHRHHQDKSYNNVILHVVSKGKSNTTTTSTGRQVPVWKMIFSKNLTDRYQSLFFNNQWVACEDHLPQMDDFFISQWAGRLLIERLEEKSELINQLLKQENNNWDQVFFILLARSFGFGVNGLPFEIMARQTPLKVLLKHANNLFQLEALLFGQAGLLKSPKKTDDYTISLKNEYHFLAQKYHLKNLEPHLWKFLRLRPSNFPTIRIAQLAMFIYITKGLFEDILKSTCIAKTNETLNINASKYWDTHYQLGKNSTANKIKHLGRSSRQIILYNTIIPYLFVYHSRNNNECEKEKIIEMLYQQPAESNSIVERWKKAGIKINNEGQAQAFIFLKNHYCNHKKCLNCRIGHKVLSKT